MKSLCDAFVYVLVLLKNHFITELLMVLNWTAQAIHEYVYVKTE